MPTTSEDLRRVALREFAAAGYHGTSIQQIAERAGVEQGERAVPLRLEGTAAGGRARRPLSTPSTRFCSTSTSCAAPRSPGASSSSASSTSFWSAPPRRARLRQPVRLAHRRAGHRSRPRRDPPDRRLLRAALSARSTRRSASASPSAEPPTCSPSPSCSRTAPTSDPMTSRPTRPAPHPRRTARPHLELRSAMAILLSRLGRFAYRRAIPVIVAWIVIAVGAVVGGLALGGTMQDSFAIPGTESQEAIDRLAAVFPQTAGASAQLVIHSDQGALDTGPLRDEIESVVTELGDDAGRRERRLAVRRVLGAGRQRRRQHRDRAGAVRGAERRGHRADARRRAGDRVDASRRAGLSVEYGGQVFQQVEFGITIIEGFGVLFAAARAHRHLRLAARRRAAAADRAASRSAARWAPCSRPPPSPRSRPRPRCSRS